MALFTARSRGKSSCGSRSACLGAQPLGALRAAPLALALLPGCEYLPQLFAAEQPISTPTHTPGPSEVASEHVAELAVEVRGLCADAERLFVAHDDMTIAEYDLDTMTRVWELAVPRQAGASGLGDCAIHGDYLYYANVGQDLIGRLDLAEGTHLPDWAPSPSGRPRAVAVGADGLIWVSSDDSPNLHALDPGSGLVAAEVPGPGLCNACDGLAAVEEGLWCTEKCEGAMVLIGWDGQIVEELWTNRASWYGLAFVGDELWGGPAEGFSAALWRITREEGSWGQPVQ